MPWRWAASIASWPPRVSCREGGEDAAGVEPAPLPSRRCVPVDVAGLELRHRGVAAVRAAQGRAHAVAARREVETVADGAAHAVVLGPAHMRLIDAALVDEVLHEAPHRVVDQGRHHGRVQAEAALEAAGDVVFAAALPHLERPRGVDPAFAGVEAAVSPRRGSPGPSGKSACHSSEGATEHRGSSTGTGFPGPRIGQLAGAAVGRPGRGDSPASSAQGVARKPRPPAFSAPCLQQLGPDSGREVRERAGAS